MNTNTLMIIFLGFYICLLRSSRVVLIQAYLIDRKLRNVRKLPMALFIALFLGAFLMTGCAGSAGGGGSASDKQIAAQPADGGTVVDPTEPVDNSNPTPTPTPTPDPNANVSNPTPTPSPTPDPTPAFVAGPLYCYVNVNVYCTNGNLGQNVIQMSMSAIFTGGNSGIQVVSKTVQNEVFANDHAVCLNANQASCYHESSCITAVLVAGGNMYSQTSCGDVVMQGTKTFGQQ